MKLYLSALALLSMAFTASGQTRSLKIDRSDGGSVVTSLSRTIAVNKGSSLHREWIVVNDSSSPVQVAAGIQPIYKSEQYSGSYSFVITGKESVTAPVAAVEAVSVLFDVWGNRMKNLRYSEVVDRPLGPAPFQEASWYASENDVSDYLTCVTYVHYVRTMDGKIWSADLSAISKKLSEIQFKISEQGLEYQPPPEKTK